MEDNEQMKKTSIKIIGKTLEIKLKELADLLDISKTLQGLAR